MSDSYKSYPIIENFPYQQIRDVQRETLETLRDNWDKFDIFVIQAPTGAGKSAIAKTIMDTHKSVSYIVPNNLLVNQFLKEFPDTSTLSRLDAYYCEEWKRPCVATRAKFRNFCKGCACGGALAKAKYRKGPGIYNYHIYAAHKVFRDVLIIDEAHNVIPFIRDRMAIRLWQHDVGYPSNMYSYQRMLEWVKSLPEAKQKGAKIRKLLDAITMPNPHYVVARATDSYNGKGTKRGEPEERDCIRLLPVDISTAPDILGWKRAGTKLILMSATIGEKDVETLGIGGRALYIRCKSPIPATRRPIIVNPVVSVNRQNLEEAASQILTHICDTLLPLHQEEKGVIHATYQLAQLFEGMVNDPRFIFHNRENKKQRYKEFIESDSKLGKVLVACGMYEGIDLPEDLGRWQVIAKVPWLSLGNPAIRYQADRDPDWFAWETLKSLIQAAGRICRGEKDYGKTYILDGSVYRLFRNHRHLLPQWFLDAVVEDN